MIYWTHLEFEVALMRSDVVVIPRGSPQAIAQLLDQMTPERRQRALAELALRGRAENGATA